MTAVKAPVSFSTGSLSQADLHISVVLACSQIFRSGLKSRGSVQARCEAKWRVYLKYKHEEKKKNHEERRRWRKVPENRKLAEMLRKSASCLTAGRMPRQTSKKLDEAWAEANGCSYLLFLPKSPVRDGRKKKPSRRRVESLPNSWETVLCDGRKIIKMKLYGPVRLPSRKLISFNEQRDI